MSRKKIILIILTILFGWLGVGRFYLRKFFSGTIKFIFAILFLILAIYVLYNFSTNWNEATKIATEKSSEIDKTIKEIEEKINNSSNGIVALDGITNALLDIVGRENIRQIKDVVYWVNFVIYFKTNILLTFVTLILFVFIITMWILDIISVIFIKSQRLKTCHWVA
ncbi:NINE protein [Mesomycoplasma neurolyticum]|uniref:TM2 domain n=1 Tax=Mesomycoplasma neurolyticum TaxID=2120 RepID=A0A449A5Z8_9BACT|nr:NINE protein [Mesomycoplasma neurolyticum]VEU59654.1 TM2 domain [Mesomycoplasma neurolyticum]